MSASLRPHTLRTEHEVDPLGLDRPDPRFAWQLEALARGAVQSAWQVQVAAAGAGFDGGLLWDSGKVVGPEQIDLRYAGAGLAAHQRCAWRVQVWDGDGVASGWSEPASFAIGILDQAEWRRAEWIGHHQANLRALPHLRRDFSVEGAVVDARLYVTAKGLIDVELNGAPASDEQLTPGWTDYGTRIYHRCWDVTALVREGANAIGAVLADGWYKGDLTWSRKAEVWGNATRALLMLRIERADGAVEWVCSDDAWTSSGGPTLMSCFLDGEHHDATLAIDGWSEPGFDAAAWKDVARNAVEDKPILQRHPAPPVKRWQEFTATEILQPAPGRWIANLGQNIAGRVRITVDVPVGTVLRLRFAEVLTPDRQLYVDNLRTALATDVYVARGGGPETWEPRFTFHGFQYVEITGLPYEPTAETLTGVVLFSDCPEAGEFRCSDEMVNQLSSNIVWTQRANHVEVPTDCPQRDERLGWTGDAQAFIRTAICYHDVQGFFDKWLVDLDDACHEDGRAPAVAPLGNTSPRPWWVGQGTNLVCYADAAWGDACTICPQTAAWCYGDREALRRQYPMMTRYLGYYRATAVPGRKVRYQPNSKIVLDGKAVAPPALFGDWLAVKAETAAEIIRTAFYAWSARMCRDAARTLGEDADAERFDQEYREVAADFCREFVDADGRVIGRSKPTESQTGYVLALHFDLLPEDLRSKALAHLVADIEARDGHLSCGFVGLPYLMPVLSRFGRSDLAFGLLTKRTYPSWGYEISHGATTIWERWNGYHDEDGPGDPNMNSYSHYAYGAVGEWLFSDVAGIDLTAEAFGAVRIRPRVGGGLTNAEATYRSVRGPIRSSWTIEGDRFELTVELPANVSARIELPTADAEGVNLDGTPVATVAGGEPGYRAVAVGGGRYVFSCAWSGAAVGA